MKKREGPDPPGPPDELMRLTDELDLTALRENLPSLLAQAEQQTDRKSVV